MTIRLALLALVAGVCLAASLSAQEPGWSSSVLPVGAEAEQIRQTPMLNRPYRPGHVYGNTVRRMHYRGNPMPMPRDFGGAGGSFFGRR